MPSKPKRRRGRSEISRRRFIQGVGAGTAAAVMAPKISRALPPVSEEIEGRQRLTIRLRINGRTYRLAVEPRATLLDVLRDHLDLTGTKRVCDRGECGACTVLLDGVPINSCLTLALEAQGHAIETIESLSSNGRPHPLQQAFIEHDAMQCGFCTPGMILSLKVLLDRQPSPSLDDVKQALSGNLCRCGSYTKIFRATQDAAAALRRRS